MKFVQRFSSTNVISSEMLEKGDGAMDSITITMLVEFFFKMIIKNLTC